MKESKQRQARTVIGRIISLIQLLASAVMLILLWKSNMLAAKPMGIIAIVLLVLLVVFWLLMGRRGGSGRFLIGAILSILVSILLVVTSYYLYMAIGTLQEITDSEEETTRVAVYVLDEDSAQTIADVAEDSFGILKTLDRSNTDKAIEEIEASLEAEISCEEYTDAAALAEALLSGECRSIILNEAFVDIITEIDGYEDFDTMIREIGYYQWTDVVEVSNTSATDEGVFIMYISGIDTSGGLSAKGRSDVNILAVVNRNTRQVLLVSTPRDYYVELSISNGVKDKLTHAGIYGIQVSMDTLAMLYDIDVDYYFRINFTGFEELIDALGGVTVQSDYAFTTGSYTFTEGTNRLSTGAEALAFARERKSFASGDRQRGKNQMAVIQGVINELQSPAVLKNFSGLMEGLEGSFYTSLPYSLLSEMVKEQLADSTSWNVVSYSVDGTGDTSTTYSMNSQLYVMVPDEDTVNTAKELISAVCNGEIVTGE